MNTKHFVIDQAPLLELVARNLEQTWNARRKDKNCYGMKILVIS